jgi:hypothetical protein
VKVNVAGGSLVAGDITVFVPEYIKDAVQP